MPTSLIIQQLLRFIRRRPYMWGLAFVLLVVGLLISEGYVALKSSGRVVATVASLPEGKGTGLVFACPATIQGYPSPIFLKTAETAVALWKSGKVSKIIVAGDNDFLGDNQPKKMKVALVAQGVPFNGVVCDDSVGTQTAIRNAKKYVGDNGRLIMVGTFFQNARAVAVARHQDLDAYGLNIPRGEGRFAFTREWFDERVTRLRTFVDLFIMPALNKN